MRKLVLAALASTALISGANAKVWNGFYVGLTAGYSLADVKYSFGNTPAITATNISAMGHGMVSGFNGGAFVGYNYMFQNCFIVGLDVMADYNTGNKTILNYTYQISGNPAEKLTAKRRWAYGVMLRGGMAVMPKTMIYIGLGGKCTDWKFKMIDANGIAINGQKHSFRFMGGVGVEGFFGSSDTWGWRFSYEYVPGKTKNLNVPTNQYLYTKNGSGAYAQATARENIVKLGIAYHF